ncbi:hypothetical protein H6503_04110 [Candidatus Woesearchaeota archaeon]|nr:hypothetical protein [Candidatus Woesearchaeota archaeon]
MSKMIGLHWPFVLATTAVLYALILITFPFNREFSTIFLFALIAYWSRLPGCGIPSPFFILYQMDVVDILSMLIAIHIDPFTGAVFSLFGNIWSRVAGITPYFSGVVKDGIIMAVICLFVPWIYALSGQDIFLCMMIFTIIRRIGFIILWFVYPVPGPFQFAVMWTGVTFVTLAVNGFYAKYFGPFFDGLLSGGAKFSWPLFIFATIVVALLYLGLTGKKSSKYMHQGYLLRKVLNIFSGNDEKKKGNEESISDNDILLNIKRII